MRGRAVASVAAGASALIFVVGCGGGDRQDVKEPKGTYTVRVVRASFPAKQQLAENATMVITVRNDSNKTVPNIAVTIGKNLKNAFSAASKQPGLADPERPIWIVDSGPRGGITAYDGTWALGSLKPGRSATFKWRVTAIKPGNYKLDYRVNAGLNGKAKAELAGGGVPSGQLDVMVTRKAAQACVTDSGEVIRKPADAAGNCG